MARCASAAVQGIVERSAAAPSAAATAAARSISRCRSLSTIAKPKRRPSSRYSSRASDITPGSEPPSKPSYRQPPRSTGIPGLRARMVFTGARSSTAAAFWRETSALTRSAGEANPLERVDAAWRSPLAHGFDGGRQSGNPRKNAAATISANTSRVIRKGRLGSTVFIPVDRAPPQRPPGQGGA